MGSACRQVVIADHLGADKSSLEIRVDLACRLGRLCPAFDCPRAHFRLACGQIADQSQQMVACLDQFLKPGLLKPQIIQEHLLLLIVKLRDLLFDLCAHDEHFTVLPGSILTDRLYARVGRAVIRQVILRHICREDHRFRGQQVISRQPCLLVFIIRDKALCHLIILKMCFHTV